MTIGQIIRTERTKLGLTQSQAAARMGRSQSYWADLEADRRSPTIHTLKRVASALGCDLECKLEVLYDWGLPSNGG